MKMKPLGVLFRGKEEKKAMERRLAGRGEKYDKKEGQKVDRCKEVRTEINVPLE
jgi:hypothetical protein